ncbi:MAG: hypothetical protein V4727_07925 [Verrucomicrobiota bacterium]
MQRIHKTLAICLLVTALVFGVLKILTGGGFFGVKGKESPEASSRDAMTRHDRCENASDSSTRKQQQRARKLTSPEAREFLKTTIIPEIHFENITLRDALKIVNEEIAKQTPDDQPKPRILVDPKFDVVRWVDLGEEMIEIKPASLAELRLRNVPVAVLLKYMCDMTRTSYWIYKGDFYVGTSFVGITNGNSISSSDVFYNREKLSHVRLEDVDASQLASKFDEIIENHDYFGPKSNINIYTTEKARAALLKGEVQLPRINLDLKNITLMEATVIIAEHTKGALTTNHQGLVFNPFNEDPFAGANSSSFPVSLDENLFKPETDLLNRHFAE